MDTPFLKSSIFGVAKALTQKLIEGTMYTLIGTPEYMSPEQADFVRAKISTPAPMSTRSA